MQTLVKPAVFNRYLVSNNGERRKLIRNTLNFAALEAAELSNVDHVRRY